jgi:KamA family protein
MADNEAPRYKPFTLRDFRELPQVQAALTEDQKFAIEVVSHVLPFRTNSYVVEQVINWEKVPDDPIFVLNFPQAEMLKPNHFEEMASVLTNGASEDEIQQTANKIRMDLNPHPAGQMEHNVPIFDGTRLHGMQHKYHETVLFFPSQGQTCHAYCTFCFRWAQFVGMDELKFASRESELLVDYLKDHEEATDVLFTGGDPLIMRTHILAAYVEPLLEVPHLRNIRIGSKALAYWPYRFLTDKDADALLALFRKVENSGKHLALMAHFNHPNELKTEAVQLASARVRETGAQIRTQSPLLRHINDDPDAWADMWKDQVRLGMVPYYFFVVRDTGAQHYFAVPLVEAWQIFRRAYNQVSGLSRTVRGPSMSCDPGKVQVNGVVEIVGEKLIALQAIQGRDPDWVGKPFFAEYDEEAIWLDDLKPAFGEEKFFFADELEEMYREDKKLSLSAA